MKNIDWNDLSFCYKKTDYNVRCYNRNGEWGELEISSSEHINIHMAATSLHYGQQAFEGLKAYRGKDNKIRVFRWQENAKRMQNSADGILMARVTNELFEKALIKVIQLNADYVPPYGTGASLYVRPLLIGTGARIGVKPSDEYLFMMFVVPVGAYFKDGFKATDFVITRKYDRAAPLGTGNIKVGGNYAASLKANEEAHANGYSSVIFLDSREKKFIDECGPANFFGIKNKTYITPKSTSILPSITNMSLMTLAKEMGLKIEQREIPVSELATFDEAGACGTAAVITPIGKIFDESTNVEYKFYDAPGKHITALYERLLAIQYGDEKDVRNWITIIEA